MTLKIANEIEEALNNEGLVGKRMGSGFCFLDNSRDVQFEYSSNEVKEYFSKIEKVISEFTEKYEDYDVSIRFRNNSFSFYHHEQKDSLHQPQGKGYRLRQVQPCCRRLCAL